MKLSRLDARKDRKIACWCRMQALSKYLEGFIDGRVNEAGVTTVAPDRGIVLCCEMDQG